MGVYDIRMAESRNLKITMFVAADLIFILCLFSYIQPLDLSKFSDVRQVISRNLTSGPQPAARQRAPLATPEHIEIGDYAQVKVSR